MGVFAGFLTGYIAYDMIHYSIHNFQPPGPCLGQGNLGSSPGPPLQGYNKGFGVSSPIWDMVFGTRHEYEKNRKQPI